MFMLNSTGHEISCSLMLKCILTFISRINTISDSFIAIFFICYEQLKFHAQLS